jgi:hypothetical protein
MRRVQRAFVDEIDIPLPWLTAAQIISPVGANRAFRVNDRCRANPGVTARSAWSSAE